MKFNPVEKIIKKIKAKKALISMCVVAVVFLFVSYFSFLNSNFEEAEVSDYSKLFGNDYTAYQDRVDGASVNMKSLVDNDQILEIKNYGELIEEKNYGKGRNAFAKPAGF